MLRKICNSDSFIHIIGLKDVNFGNIKELFDEIDKLKDDYFYQIFDANAIGGI